MNLQTLIFRSVHYLKYKLYAHSINNLHSPFLYTFMSECLNKKNLYYEFENLKLIRKKLLQDERLLPYESIGAPSLKLKKHEKIKNIVRIASSPAKYSELYFRIIQFLQSKVVLELGTSVGLNTLYLSKATTGKVISIEGQKELYHFAKKLLEAQNINNTHLIYGLFDKILPDLLKQNTFDFVLMDGNHTYEATLNYYTLLLPKMSSLSVIIMDDIYWNKEMNKAWKDIQKEKTIKYTIDLFKCGIILFHPYFIHSQHFTFHY